MTSIKLRRDSSPRLLPFWWNSMPDLRLMLYLIEPLEDALYEMT